MVKEEAGLKYKKIQVEIEYIVVFLYGKQNEKLRQIRRRNIGINRDIFKGTFFIYSVIGTIRKSCESC